MALVTALAGGGRDVSYKCRGLLQVGVWRVFFIMWALLCGYVCMYARVLYIYTHQPQTPNPNPNPKTNNRHQVSLAVIEALQRSKEAKWEEVATTHKVRTPVGYDMTLYIYVCTCVGTCGRARVFILPK